MRNLYVVCLLLSVFNCIAQTPDVSVTVSNKSVYVGQLNQIKVTILVPTWLTKPLYFNEVENVNLISLNSEKSAFAYSKQIKGKTWSGVVKEFNVIPMKDGQFTITIPPIDVHFMGEHQNTIKHTIAAQTVTFSATIPLKAKSLSPLIIAENITLNEQINAPEPITKGSVLERIVTLDISGTSGIFIPELLSEMSSTQFKAYSPNHRVNDRQDARNSALISTVTQSQSVLLLEDGNINLTGISLNYYQPSSDTVKTVKSEIIRLNVETAPRSTQQTWIIIVFISVCLLGVIIFRERFVNLLSQVKHRFTTSEWYLYYQCKQALTHNHKHALLLYLKWQAHWQATLCENHLLWQNAKQLQSNLEQAIYFEKSDSQLVDEFKQLRLRLTTLSSKKPATLDPLNPK